MTKVSTVIGSETDFIGLDLSDKTGTYVVVSAEGAVVKEAKLTLTPAGVRREFAGRPPAHIAIEVGGQSAWVSRALSEMGYEVTVANPRQVKLIYKSQKKNDRLDAEHLARLLRLDAVLLRPVQHRGASAQADLALLRSRDLLVRERTRLINHTRSSVKALGNRLPKCAAESFHRRAQPHLPEVLKPALEPILGMIAGLTERIRAMEHRLERLADESYAETRVLRQIKGVGVITALGFVLSLEEPQRFAQSRSVGAFLGLTSRQYESGESRPQLRITKAGDPFLRRLVVQSAHYILGPFGEDCQLRRWGFSLMRGSDNPILKKKAVVAVARKLAVLLHHLWLSGEVYEPLYGAARAEEAA